MIHPTPEMVRFDPARLFTRWDHRGQQFHPSNFPHTVLVTDQPVPDETAAQFGAVLPSLDGLDRELFPRIRFFVYFLCDSDALPVIREIQAHGGSYIPHLDFSKTQYRFVNRHAHDAMQRTWALKDRVSHLQAITHENLCEALDLTQDVPGDYVEIGVYLGGSALTALHYLEETGSHRKAWLLDTFDGFNYAEADRSPDAIWAHTHGLYGVQGTMDHIRQTFAGITVPFELVAANICRDPLPAGVGAISVANIDVDMYEPTLAALHAVAPRLSPGGIIIAEDAASTPGLYGAYVAMHEFLASPAGQGFRPLFKQGQYFLMRRA